MTRHPVRDGLVLPIHESTKRLPGNALVRGSELFGVKDFGQKLGGVGQARSRTVEVLIAIGQIDTSLASGSKLGESGLSAEGGHLGPGARQIESAGQDQNDVRVCST